MNRRTFLSYLTTSSLGPLLTEHSVMALAGTKLTVGLPDLPPNLSLTGKHFMALSMLLLEKDLLSQVTSNKILAAIGCKRSLLTTLYSNIASTAQEGRLNLMQFSASEGFPGEEQRTLALQIIRAWYTGVYKDPGSTRQTAKYLDYYNALMYQATQPYRSVPSQCGKFGYWIDRPADPC